MKHISSLILIMMLSVGTPYAQSHSDWTTAKTEAFRNLANEHDCEAFWNTVWPWAKQGETEARAMLASLVAWGGLMPPGSSDAYTSRFEHAVTLLIHGGFYAYPDPETGPDWGLRNRLTRAFSGDDGLLNRQFKDMSICIGKGAQTKDCIDQSVKAGLVQPFSDYAAKIDILSQSHFKPARCVSKYSFGYQPPVVEETK